MLRFASSDIGTSINSSPIYRPDIDGLRAVAVVAVLLFHGGVESVSGGYVGVDVFFVISGFLITSIIVAKVDAGTFSVVDFWERRVRRIIPALMVVALFTLLMSWWLFFPDDYKDFSESLAAIAVFSSNILFWTEEGYFAAPAEFKPLLHTWSLAIEEQFYLLFPFLMMGLGVGRERLRIPMLLLLAGLSFAVSVHWVRSYPDAAFYLLPARAWELSIGALLVFIRLNTAPMMLRQCLSLAGMSMILYSYIAFDADTRFPGAAALMPCLGTALIIFSQSPSHKTWCYGLLTLRPVVFIGLLSYSLYLWHWPLLAFARYHAAEHLPAWQIAALLAASFVLAYMSWRFIEQPIRKRRLFITRKAVFSAAIVAGLTCIGIGVAGHYSEGFPKRIDAEVLSIYSGHEYYNSRRAECLNVGYQNFDADKICELGDQNSSQAPQFLMVGDSHANSLMPLIDRLSTQYGVNGLFAAYNGCPPLLGVYRNEQSDLHNCDAFNRAMIELAATQDIDTVLLVARWNFYPEQRMISELNADGRRPDDWLSAGKPSPEQARAVFDEGFERLIRQFSEKAKLWVMLQPPLQAENISPRFLASQLWQGEAIENLGVSLQEHRQYQSRLNELLSHIAAQPKYRLTLLDPTPYLCDVQGMRPGTCPVVRDGGAVYRDDDHLSTFGSGYLQALFDDFFQSLR